uniref:Uncharacterized protein n=1 Tax=viral metagenome TaxID=1070528 RepID=A0A6C0EJJ1_9ZZZZ
MSFLSQILASKKLPKNVMNNILSFIDEEVMLKPKSPVRVAGIGQDQFNMYKLEFTKMNKIKDEKSIYICDCKQLPRSCCCEPDNNI